MEYNFKKHKTGDTFNGVDFELLINGLPKDLTGATIKMQLKKDKNSPAVLTLSSTVPEQINITDALSGLFSIVNQVISVPEGNYIYDIQFTFADGTVKTYISGGWPIINDVTT